MTTIQSGPGSKHNHPKAKPGATTTGDESKHTHPVEVDLSGYATKSELVHGHPIAINDAVAKAMADHEARFHGEPEPEPPSENPPTPDPEPDEPPFLSRRADGRINIDGGTDVVINDRTVLGMLSPVTNVIGITVRNVRNLRIANVDLANLVGGIYLYNISGRLEIENVRSRNIGDVRPGDSSTIGSGKGNHIQLSESTVEGYIRSCRFLGGRSEDMLSIFHSGGVSADRPLVISGNAFQGLIADTATARAWTSNSGTGMCICDGGGSSKNGHVHVIGNTLLNPGQVGINIIDGPGLRVNDNVLCAEPYGPNNNALTTYEGTPVGIASGNRYDWVNANGSRPTPWKHPGGSGMAFTGNVQDPSIDPKALAVVL